MKKDSQARGFSLLELAVVLAIGMTLAAVAVPSASGMIAVFRLRNAASDYAGILQQARSRAVQDSRFYSTYVKTVGNVNEAFVNIYPQNNDGTSGSSNGSTIDPKDPIVNWPKGVNLQPQGSAPSTSALQALFLPASGSVTPTDGSLTASPVTFGPMGTPCTPTAGTGGSYCNASTGAVAFWVFMQNTSTSQWEAITVTPAGKVQKWSYSGTWSAL